ncbi:hypothetical protein GCM10009846_07410 [Agrococcus versicolor]|uniref:Uncharacterized protein n=1 Tax=Agrococcus versicolor TaxID=501482 RepID=A0ABN3ALQ1_9MICO
MGFGTAAMMVFALGQLAVVIAMVRLRRASVPATPEGRRRASRVLTPWLVLWCVCALVAAGLVVLGDPGMLVFVATVVLFGGILLGVALVVGRNLDRDLDRGPDERDDAVDETR